MLKKTFIFSIIFLVISGIYTVLAPESKASYGGTGVLISGGIILLLGVVWVFSKVSQLIRKVFNINVSESVSAIEVKTKSPRSKVLKTIKMIFLSGLGLLFAFIFVYIFITQPHVIDGNSMEPTVFNGQRVFTNKLIYRINYPERGDVIIFHLPQDERIDAIARIIAIPNDRVLIKDGSIILNGQKLDEPYLKELNSTIPGDFILENEEKVLRENEYVVMSDKRSSTNDSRSYGYVNRDSIVGKIK